ncbi:hypothetical protein RJ55_04065 [Drechmeria coniospora]|nr:hypothetical protein RJ55_04065 [Drechmeria coniospora]
MERTKGRLKLEDDSPNLLQRVTSVKKTAENNLHEHDDYTSPAQRGTADRTGTNDKVKGEDDIDHESGMGNTTYSSELERDILDGHESWPAMGEGDSDRGSSSSDDDSYACDEDESSSQDDGEGESSRGKKKGTKGKMGKLPRCHPKTAREYMARKHEVEDARERKQRTWHKRKRAKENERGGKKRVVGGDAAMAHMARQKNTPRPCGDSDDEPSEEDGMPPAPIEASTKALQLRLMKKRMPRGADTRRSSTQEADLNEATVVFGRRKIEARDGKWRHKSMSCYLESYQLTAASWMVQRELGRSTPYGGLLADEMGLGKTVMSLTCIVGNPAEKEDVKEYSLTTLVIVPNKSIAYQWKSEVETHCKPPFDGAAVYSAMEHGQAGALKRVRVLITTYNELMNHYPSKRLLAELKAKYDTDNVSYNRAVGGQTKFLFKTKWYRVMLDEGHKIKSIQSRSTMLCCMLVSKYRWVLTGTPLANSVLEFFPYFKFIGCEFTESLQKFQAKYLANGKANEDFERLVAKDMYRRTANDTFMGYKLGDNLKSHRHDLWVQLSDEETCLAELVATHFQEKIIKGHEERKRKRLGKAIGDGNILEHDVGLERETGLEREASGETETRRDDKKNHTYLMMGVLRQAVSHPYNLEKFLRTRATAEEICRLRAKLGQFAGRRLILEQMKDGDDGNLERYKSGIEFLRTKKEAAFGGKFTWDDVLAMLEEESGLKDVTCSNCKTKPPLRPVQLETCGHYLCANCHLGLMHPALLPWGPRSQASSNNKVTQDVKCREPGCTSSANICSFKASQTLVDIIHRAKSDRFQEPGRDSNNVHLYRSDDENGCFIASARHDYPLLPSTKLTAAMVVIAAWLHDSPEDKIIVFVQFIMTGKVLGRMLEMAGLQHSFLYYLGRMSPEQKSKSLADFKNDDGKKILIASMQGGGQGLNLTMANRVILVDPWWNSAAEEQAFCRVKRKGQKKGSHFVRILVSSSIDTDMSSLQRVKSEEIDNILQDNFQKPSFSQDEELHCMFSKSRLWKQKAKDSGCGESEAAN